MANKPCNDCQNYDVILRGKEPTRRGWCAAKSEYPAKEQKGQVFPAGVTRVNEGELAKPVIVVGSEVIPACALFRAKPARAS